MRKKKNNNWQPVIFAGIIIVLLIFALSNAPTDTIPDLGEEDKTIEGECVTDKDCRVAGCSGQVCTTAGAARGTFTTCEWTEEYGCLEYTSCGCVNGQCNWKESSEYDNCIEGLNE